MIINDNLFTIKSKIIFRIIDWQKSKRIKKFNTHQDPVWTPKYIILVNFQSLLYKKKMICCYIFGSINNANENRGVMKTSNSGDWYYKSYRADGVIE